MKWLWLVLDIGFLFTLGCTNGLSGQKSDTFQVKPPKLTMGTSAEYPPFEFRQNGEIVGIDIDIAQAITQKLGYTLEVQDMDFSGTIPAMQSGRVQFVMAGMTVTEERKANIDFSDVYYMNTLSLLTKKSAKSIGLQDLSGQSVGVQLGSIMEKMARQKFKTSKIVSLPKNTFLIEELKSGRIQTVILEHVQALAFSQVSKDFLVTNLPDWTGDKKLGFVDGYAIAFPKAGKLRDSFNRALQTLKKEGILDQIIKKWIPG